MLMSHREMATVYIFLLFKYLCVETFVVIGNGIEVDALQCHLVVSQGTLKSLKVEFLGKSIQILFCPAKEEQNHSDDVIVTSNNSVANFFNLLYRRQQCQIFSGGFSNKERDKLSCNFSPYAPCWLEIFQIMGMKIPS